MNDSKETSDTLMGGKYESVSSEDVWDKKKKSGLFSYLFFTWVNELLKLGHKRPLTDDDLFELSDEDKAQDLVEDLNKLWMEEISSAEKKGVKPRLWKAMWKLFLQDIILFTFLRLTDNAMQFTLVITVWFYLKFLEMGSSMDKTYAVAVVVGIGIPSLVKVFCYHHCDYLSVFTGMRLKRAVIGLIHKKITESRRSDLSKFTSGHIVNLVSNDAKRMEKLGVSLAETLTVPFVIVAVVLILPVLVGWQSLSCLLLMVFLMIVKISLVHLFSKIRLKQAKVTDKRLAAVSEMISGIRAVKMYAWEWKCKETVETLRRKEIGYNKQKSFIITALESIRCNISAMGALVCVITFVFSETKMDAVTVFTLTIILEICADCLAIKIAFHFLSIRDASVSIDRIEEFLCLNKGTKSWDTRRTEGLLLSKNLQQMSTLSDSEISCMEKYPFTRSNNEPPVNIIEMSAAWTSDHRCVLHQVSFTVNSNQLFMVTGPVGSGKTSLLMAILGEIPITEGAIQTHGFIAYVSQTPWIFSGSIRENIVFGRSFDETRYNRILEICDLHKDIKCFPYEDLTIIGQRGVGLSGGQRARVSLARAVYSEANIFLLDDPLSAVDARVGQHIMDECICGELSNRTRILVTHQVQHLPRADKIAVVREGTSVTGTYAELRDKELLDNLQKRHEDATCDSKLLDSVRIHRDSEFTCKDMKEDDEDRATGTVSWRVYWEFLRVGLPAVLIGCLALFYVIAQASIVAPSWWMSRIVHMSLQEQRSFFSLGVFGGLVAAALAFTLVKDLSLTLAILRSSRMLHEKMTLAVIKCPVLFFDTNPAGRIMNRFSKDIGAMDDLLTIQLTQSVALCLHIIVVVSLALTVNLWTALAVIPMGMLFFFLTAYYLKSSRELKRMEAIRCSPVYDHVAETIAGLEVIRTSNMQEECCNQMTRLQYEYNKALFLVMASSRWLGLYLDLLCVFFLVGIAIVGLVAIQDHALAGMLLSLSITLFSHTQYGIRIATEVESQMTSVERVMTYSNLSSEPGYSRQNKPPDDWPSQGSLSIRNLSMVYLEGGPLALRDVNLDVQAKEKIGIVGRTGAGKSSLVAALFRMPDPQGQVLIDGVDLGTINIMDTRRSMAVITQDPVLFAGSLRKNLDPFNSFPDQAIWTALEQVQLMKKVSQLPQQLEFCVGEGGSGFSVGERQLLCLARALLQKCKILVLDEATANVDYKTDQLIQQVIRQNFTNCTVLTIAHRLNTIMDYDKVVVLDQGHVVEYDNPRVLAEKENGFFSRLINTSPENIG